MKRASPNLSAYPRRTVAIEAVIALAAEPNPGEITTSAIGWRINRSQEARFRPFLTKDAVMAADHAPDRRMGPGPNRPRRARSLLPSRRLESYIHDPLRFHGPAPRDSPAAFQRDNDPTAKRVARTLLTQYAGCLNTLTSQGKIQDEVTGAIKVNPAATLFIGLIQGLIMQPLIVGKMTRIRGAVPAAFAIFARIVKRVS
ncbi:MAG: TetR/AcrR family transcriptional regulator [Opitutaceae bacterium]